MIDLNRHIEILLLSNDCVIVPRLGGFMAHAVEARYDAGDQLFLPPMRTLGFNPQLTINDSLLVQSYIEAYDISYPEALGRIEDEVEEIKQHLQNEGVFELNNIGTLTLNDDGRYVFAPSESGILTPTLYGLSSVEMKRQADSRQPMADADSKIDSSSKIQDSSDLKPETCNLQPETSDLNPETSDLEPSAPDVIHIKYTWVRNAVAVAAILLALFILALPSGKTDMMTRTISNLNNGLLFGMMSEDTNMSKIRVSKIEEHLSKTKEKVSRSKDTIKADSVNVSSSKIQDSSNLKPDTCNLKHETCNLKPETSNLKHYCIVLATHVTMRNANAFVEQLKQKGFEQSKVFVRNNITRVIYGHYATESDAYNDLRRFHRQSETAEAWVMPL